MEAHLAHNQEYAGSSPTPAIKQDTTLEVIYLWLAVNILSKYRCQTKICFLTALYEAQDEIRWGLR